MKINLLTIILILFALALAFVWFTKSREDVQPTLNTSETSKSSNSESAVNIPDTWPTHENTGFSFRYPENAKAETRNQNNVVESVVFFMGQKQIDSGRTQTEIFDGYIFNIRDITSEVTSDFEAFAMAERDNAKAGCEQENGFVSQLEKVTLNQIDGFQFYSTNCYIDYTQTLLSTNEKYFRISQSYVGDPEDYDKYKDTTFMILSSLEFSN